MLRISLPVVVAALAVAGAAAAQPGYDRSGYGQPAYGQPGYPQAPAAPRQGGYDQGYDADDAGGAPPPAGAGGYAGQQGAPDLGRDLGLRPDQRGALQAYQQATTPSAAEQQQAQADERRIAAMTTPQRLDFVAAQMRRDEADFARRADAVRRFYAQLTPEQQRRFDQLTGPGAEGAPGGDDGYDGRAPAPPR